MNSPPEFLFPILLYAEIHYRFFKGFPSFLFRHHPEVLFDTPRRIAPGKDLPITLIINDFKSQFQVDEVNITISQPGKPILKNDFRNVDSHEVYHPLSKTQKVYLFQLKRSDLPEGNIFINCKATLHNGNRTLVVLNDNIPTSSKASFSCTCASDNLPGSFHALYGDIHFHSQFSQSHVEFGPPFEIIDRVAAASGLDFLAVSDHSYDLACSLDNYLIEDQHLGRWKQYLNEVNRADFSTMFLPSEEVSCLNSEKNVIHLCGIGLSSFIPGSMDGARRNILHTSQLSIKQAVNEIHVQHGFAFAAHPGSKKSILQVLFLNRGTWSENDVVDNDLDGIQAFNGSYKGAWERGKKLWIQGLQRGRRLTLCAGNDAHGDFNRYRAIKVPFLSIFENFERFMGYGKTGVYTQDRSRETIIECIKNGKTFITTGPYISICFSANDNDCAISTKPIPKTTGGFFVIARSTSEFGQLARLNVYGCDLNSSSEVLLHSNRFKSATYEVIEGIELPGTHNFRYIRAEVNSLSQSITYQAFTSPVYFT